MIFETTKITRTEEETKTYVERDFKFYKIQENGNRFDFKQIGTKSISSRACDDVRWSANGNFFVLFSLSKIEFYYIKRESKKGK